MAVRRVQRRSAREIEARRKARERTAEVRAREQKLEDLATSYFLASGEIADAEDRAETRLREYAEKVEEETKAATEPLRARQAAVVREMLVMARIGAVAERLGEPRDTIAQFRTAETPALREAPPAASEVTAARAPGPSRHEQPGEYGGGAEAASQGPSAGLSGTV